MKRINKTCHLSTTYKNWEEELEISNTTHPKYTNTSTRNLHYQNIKMQLYSCQGGLCAYTEMRLCPEEYYASTHWNNGKYQTSISKGIARGQLDHFDESLKSKKVDLEGRKDWLWSNFFMVDSDINTVVKNNLPVDPILKPDNDDYDPFRLLEYDPDTHIFFPNPALDQPTQDIVEESIKALGINTVYSQRRNYILKEVQLISLEQKSFEEIIIDQFPTSFEMYRRKKLTPNDVTDLLI
jgi:hypothetical protein